MSLEEKTNRGVITEENVMEVFEENGIEGVDKYNIRIERISCDDRDNVEIEIKGAWALFLRESINDNKEKLEDIGLHPEPVREPELPLRGKISDLPHNMFN